MKLKSKNLKITCDGGAATGKSTGAKLIAKKYGLSFMSSGLLYRYASFLVLKHKPKKVVSLLKKEFKNLNYKNLNKLNLHSSEISNQTSLIAKNAKVRNILKIYQKNFIKKNKYCVLEGRDASTKILPDSDVKFFFVCNLNVAARRRFNELKKRSKKINYNEVKRALFKRNLMDRTRSISPLQKHRDAVVVNTTKLGKKAMVAKMSKYIERVIKQKYGN